MNPENPAGQARPPGSGAMSERMQALLSRAAEEQLNEQRQVSVVLGDLRQLLTGLNDRVDALALRLDEQVDQTPTGVPDSLSALQREVSGLDDRLEVAAQRPVLTEQTLLASLSPVFSRLDALDERLSGLSDTAERLPGVATTLTDVADRVDALSGLRDEVAGLRAGVSALREDQSVSTLVSSVAAMRGTVEELGGRVAKIDVPTGDDVAAAVGQQVTDRLVDELAPRIADLVMHKMASTLVDQVSSGVSASVQSGLAEEVRTVSADSERRISAHVDDAVLALAEALLRRRRTGRGFAAPAPDPAEPGLGADSPALPAEPEAAGGADSPRDVEPLADARPPADATPLAEPGPEPGSEPAGVGAATPVPPAQDAPADLDAFAARFQRPPRASQNVNREQGGGGWAADRPAEPDLPEIWPADADRPQEPFGDGQAEQNPQAGGVDPSLPPVARLRTPATRIEAAGTLQGEQAGGERKSPFEWEPQPPAAGDSAAPAAATQAQDRTLDAQDEAADYWDDAEGEDGPRRRPWWRPGG